jgi:methylphosphotriester-DNA--protein-cysteine methyltransferase
MSAAQEHVRDMMDRIEQSYSEPITLHSLADDLRRQDAYHGAMFRREIGVPMRQWLTSVRLDTLPLLFALSARLSPCRCWWAIGARRTSIGSSHANLEFHQSAWRRA